MHLPWATRLVGTTGLLAATVGCSDAHQPMPAGFGATYYVSLLIDASEAQGTALYGEGPVALPQMDEGAVVSLDGVALPLQASSSDRGAYVFGGAQRPPALR